MRDTSAHSIRSVDNEGDRTRVLYIWPMNLPQLLCIPGLQNIELSMKITNIAKNKN
jgi:hypothetical protein